MHAIVRVPPELLDLGIDRRPRRKRRIIGHDEVRHAHVALVVAGIPQRVNPEAEAGLLDENLRGRILGGERRGVAHGIGRDVEETVQKREVLRIDVAFEALQVVALLNDARRPNLFGRQIEEW